MIETVFQLLSRVEGTISESQIRRAVGISSQQDTKELSRLLNSDKRFVSCPDLKWKCTPLEDLIADKPIKDVTFVITDIETTGSIRGKDRIIEIAAIKVRNGEILGEFETLVNPHKNISKQINRLTKITNEIVKNAPTIETVLPDYVDFVDHGIFVAHNSLFDFSFINAETRRLKVNELKSQTDICTYRIARKLLPDVKARGISGLSLYFDYQMENRHRAMPDVLATNYFLNKFLEQLNERNITTLHKLIEFQRDKISKKELRKKMRRQKRKTYRSRKR